MLQRTALTAPHSRRTLWLAALLLGLVGCGGGGTTPGVFDIGDIAVPRLRFDAPDFADTPFDEAGWSEATHTKEVDGDFDTVLPSDEVVAITITLRPSTWRFMLDEMSQRFGPFGGAGSIFPPDVENPSWVPCTVQANGLTWWHVGMRFKGASTLNRTWRVASLKLPFRLDFDQFEDDHPEIDNQRFYGFKKLSFANGAYDASAMREKVSGDLLASQGVPSPPKAFYRVSLDVGHGPTLLGVYVATVDPSDKAYLRAAFDNTKGNLYKPDDSPAARWLPGVIDDVSFPKKSNEDEADWSDVIAARDALHAPRDDPEAWRDALEARFDGHGFMRWLAASNLILNADGYGFLAHNYFLYGDEDQGDRLRWIAWDLDLTLLEAPTLLPMNPSSVGNGWPLIQVLATDTAYRATYDAALSDFLAGAFERDSLETFLDAQHALIAPHVEAEHPALSFTDPARFVAELATIKANAAARRAEARAYLDD